MDPAGGYRRLRPGESTLPGPFIHRIGQDLRIYIPQRCIVFTGFPWSFR
jgi:hypothetical protein